MIWEKTWLSYFIWICYTSIICLQSISVLIVAGKDLGIRNQYIILGIIILFFLIIAAGYFWIETKKKIPKNKKKSKKFANNTLILCAIIPALIIGIGLRVYTIMNINLDELIASPYIAEGFVQGVPLESSTNGITFLYLTLLRIIFSFFGNHGVAALWLQLLLQIITAFALYEGLRLLVNRTAGVVFFVAIMIFPEAIDLCSYATPMTLQLFFLSIGFMVLGNFFFKRREGTLTSLKAYMFPCLMGIYYGLIIYADITGILLMLLGFSIWRTIGKTSSKEGESGHREVQILLMIIFTIIGLLGSTLVNSFVYRKPINIMIEDWYIGFANQINVDPLAIMYLDPITSIVLHGFLFLGIFVYFKNKEKDSISGFYTIFLGLILLIYTGIGSEFILTPIFYHLIIILIVSAVFGNLVMYFPKEIVETENAKKNVVEEEMKIIEVEKKMVEGEEADKQPKVQMLHNPLPVPKKHIPKTMDFDIDVEDLEDDYDIKDFPNDDYDIS